MIRTQVAFAFCLAASAFCLAASAFVLAASAFGDEELRRLSVRRLSEGNKKPLVL